MDVGLSMHVSLQSVRSIAKEKDEKKETWCKYTNRHKEPGLLVVLNP